MRILRSNRLAAVMFLTLLCSCAGYTITHNGEGDGYDVYRPEPYLLLVSGARGGNNASIIWLPDYGTRYRVDTWNFLAKADFSFDIKNGWMLTRISDESDTTELPDAFVKAMEQARKSDAIPLSGEPFQMFKIIFAADGRIAGLAKLPLDISPDRHLPPEVPD